MTNILKIQDGNGHLGFRIKSIPCNFPVNLVNFALGSDKWIGSYIKYSKIQDGGGSHLEFPIRVIRYIFTNHLVNYMLGSVQWFGSYNKYKKIKINKQNPRFRSRPSWIID